MTRGDTTAVTTHGGMEGKRGGAGWVRGSTESFLKIYHETLDIDHLNLYYSLHLVKGNINSDFKVKVIILSS